ncbi:hypothetical protein A8C32_00130 [Flavivirga aquatica]|uniref:DUF547 domain-containing protein n=2 Tax=Flavivirga aquatica TaxID=1849968 RepID=A0A1E5TBG7_9FLAO|nr:hypothetical protein A8C32_00130 [Flavivirga aquatica]
MLSEQLLLAVKKGEDTTALRLQLKKIDFNVLMRYLINDDYKKAFWINIYNAYFLILRKEKQIEKPTIYKKKLFEIAEKQFSLDDVEHGILRRNKYKYSRGWITKLFGTKIIKNTMVKSLDYRIHFALNCGAKSCPPIAFYTVDNISNQLDMATQSFLEGESNFDDEKKEVKTTALFNWYLADFGGDKGVRTIFKNQLNRDISGYTIKYKTYSWEENLDNFIS